jgi:hypothetical protein
MMTPFDVLIPGVPDAELGPLLTRLSHDGLEARVLGADDAAGASARVRVADGGELPAEWRLVRELDGQSYNWPRMDPEIYVRYRVFAAQTQREGMVHIALGQVKRGEAWGRDRTYVIAFLTSGTPQVPLVEFLEVDDYETTGELLAIIRGSDDGGKKMYDPAQQLPPAYEPFRVEIYRDRIDFPRSWNKLAVIAHKDDETTMLNHALLQARRRGDV